MDWYLWLCRAGLHPDVALEYALLFARNELGAADVRHLDHEFLLSMGVAVAKHRLEILKLARKESSSSSSAAVMAATTVLLPWRATGLLAAAVHRSARSALGRLRASVPSRARDRDRAAAVGVLAAPRLMMPLLRHRAGGGRVAHGTWGKIASPPVAAAKRGGGGGKLLPVPPALPPMLAHVISRPVVLTNSCADKWRGTGAAVKALLPPPAPAPAPSDGSTIAAACLASADDAVCSCDEGEEGEVSDDEEAVIDGGEEMRWEWESMFQDLKPT